MFPGGFNLSYQEYLVLRGYDPSCGALTILKRALITSWSEPGFHRFWRLWNPGIGHILYRFYRLLGGNRYPLIASMVVFSVCGFIHDALVMMIFQRSFIAFTTAFTLFGFFAVLNRYLEPVLNQKQWPGILNVLVNLTLLAVSIHTAVQLQMSLFP